MTIATPQTPGLIDTLSAGYEAVTDRLWVLLVPVGLDLLLWYSTPISFAPLLRTLRAELSGVLALALPDAPQREAVLVQVLNADVRVPLAWANAVPLWVPDAAAAGPQRVFFVASPFDALLTVVSINTLTLLCSGLYLVVLANAVQAERRSVGSLLRQVPRALLWFGLYTVLLFWVAVLLCVPVGLALLVVAELSPGLAPLVLFVGLLSYFWFFLYTGFGVEAAVLERVSLLTGMVHSALLVRRHVLSALLLLGLSAGVNTGLGLVWYTFVQSGWLLIVAIVCQAYVSSGLAAARFVFYQQRAPQAAG